MKSTRLLLAIPLLPALAATALALDISWPLTGTVPLGTPEGFTVEAIQSNPPGQPIVFGRPGPEAGNIRFQPSLQKSALVFRGPQTSYVAKFWKNYRVFSVEIDVTFDSVATDQTLLRVTNVWELRLVTEGGSPKLQFIGFREPLKPVAATLEGIEAGKKYSLKARMEADGKMNFDSDSAGSAQATLGQPAADFSNYPELFVGSSNPDKFARALQGNISRLRISAEDAP
jgi:hypothetical protein